MLLKLNSIIIYGLGAFFLALAMYPVYIMLLKKWNVGKTIREETVTGEKATIFVDLHKHKTGTPNLWGGMFLIIMAIMIGLSLILQYYDIINNSLISRQETYIILFGFFSMGVLGLIDDYLNVKWHGAIKWLSAKAKLIGMFLIAGFISRFFYSRLGIDYINLRPIAGKIDLGILYPIITFFITISIVNAINITDWLDGLAGWLMAIILLTMAIATFFYQTYIATTVLVILIAVLLAFLRYNINPAKIFMGDSGAFALWWLLASLLYILNMRMGIFIPFILIFAIFIAETWSSALQIFRRKMRKKKLFPVAPLHHMYEKAWHKETSIVMKARLIQWILAAITMIAIFYQFNIPLLP
jgi:phospho-N-acetylmuramoyl-pentapeptide-transferase